MMKLVDEFGPRTLRQKYRERELYVGIFFSNCNPGETPAVFQEAKKDRKRGTFKRII